MKAVVIDDESKAINLLKIILRDYCPEIKEVYTAVDLPSGIKTIQKHKPDIIFLDIEMPGYSGLQILDFFDEEQITFQIIFTTAYDSYAIKAFELNATAYLLKPLSPKLVAEAVVKAGKQTGQQQTIRNQLAELKEALTTPNFGKIGLPMANGLLFVKLESIIMFKADGMYTKVFIEGEEDSIVSKPLKHFADMLVDFSFFFRTHRSYLINIRFIKQLVKNNGSYLIMDNEEIASISKERQKAILEIIGKI
jgi:two-component system LytT family response regulator